MGTAKIRLCVDHPLGEGQSLPLTEAQAHYLFGVMREGVGTKVLVFNGRDGEWLAEVTSAGKRGGTLTCQDQTRPQGTGTDLWLLFAPVKKARTDFIVEKSVELGVSKIMPIQTDFTNAERIRQDKAEAHVREAAEQCETTVIPEVLPLEPLGKLLAGWDPTRRILWADESGARSGVRGTAADFARLSKSTYALLIGPEGGFSDKEREKLRALPFVTPVSLGPRILRAETAALSLIVLWQAHLGDWT